MHDIGMHVHYVDLPGAVNKFSTVIQNFYFMLVSEKTAIFSPLYCRSLMQIKDSVPLKIKKA